MPSYIAFHPSFTALGDVLGVTSVKYCDVLGVISVKYCDASASGFHPSILVGLYGGVIIKQNSAASQAVVFAEVQCSCCA